jgi:hypothetical protein
MWGMSDLVEGLGQIGFQVVPAGGLAEAFVRVHVEIVVCIAVLKWATSKIRAFTI